MKKHFVLLLGFVFFGVVGCSESQNDAGIQSEDDTPADTSGDTTDTESEPIDPNAWHDDCPVDEREQRMIDVGEVSLNVACRGSGPTTGSAGPDRRTWRSRRCSPARTRSSSGQSCTRPQCHWCMRSCKARLRPSPGACRDSTPGARCRCCCVTVA